ncbi:MAG: hypothetical protein ACI9UA_001997 [Pseudoalteromonas tetraodonis]|jgi:hypothetical protein
MLHRLTSAAAAKIVFPLPLKTRLRWVKAMCPILILHCASTWALAGLIWTVQLVLYPQFDRVGREAFPSYHASHMLRITFVVAPLMLVEIGTVAWLVTFGGERNPWLLASLPLLALNWIATGLIQVPLHKKLEHDGYDGGVSKRLTLSNWLRTASWSLRALLVAMVLL